MFQRLSSSIKIVILMLAACCCTAIAQDTESSRPVLDFDGNKVFAKQELLNIANECVDRYTQAGRAYETEILDYCLHQVRGHMVQKGYIQAAFGKTVYTQNENVLQATIPVTEGPLFRVGEVKVENAQVLSSAQIVDMIGLNPGDVADGDKLSTAVFEQAAKVYRNFGYIQYTAEINPTFHAKEGAAEGIVDIQVSVDEGPQFKLRSVRFAGADDKHTEMLRRELMVRDGEIYNADLFSRSLTRINNTGLYAPVDPDRDVDFRINQKSAYIDVTIRFQKRAAATIAANP